MSPRRSSRARATQPPPSAPVHTNSSTSSVSSGRAERSTRSKDKLTPSQRSNPRSQSVDDLDEPARPLRRTRSGAEEVKEPKMNDQEEEDDGEEEEEVTRCICGQTEYPGLPSVMHDLLKQQAKEPGAAYTLEAISDDLGGMFIQCDICKVWQHGGCVGILDDSSAPDEYFCEQCRRDLHKVATSPGGQVTFLPLEIMASDSSCRQRFSKYLPLTEESSSLASPQPASRERSKRSADAKGRSGQEPRRRATLNSRDIYDEEEALRRAIEESKRDGASGSIEGLRKKRSRSDSEDLKDTNKRQRTGTKSISPDAEKAIASNSSSDEALAIKREAEHTPKKNIRGAAARNHQAKELREQKERERQDAAAKRRSRVERRRGDESPSTQDDPSHPPPTSNVSTPPAIDVPPPRSSHRKTARSVYNASSAAPINPAKPARRTGRNQYTKDLPPSSLSNTLDPNDDSRNGGGGAAGVRTRSRSRSNARDLDSPSGATSSANGIDGSSSAHNTSNANGGSATNALYKPNGVPPNSLPQTASSSAGGAGAGAGADLLRPSRPKHMNPNRTSMNEMKKRVAAILEFVSRAEEEGRRKRRTNTGTSTATGSSSENTNANSADSSKAGGDGGVSEDGGSVAVVAAEGSSTDGSSKADEGGGLIGGPATVALDFGALEAADMLRALKARLVSWEDEFGRYGAAR